MVGLLWGLFGDELCLCRPINTCEPLHPATFTGWNPPSCIKNSIAPVQLGSTSRISSGWTHTVLTTEHGLAYVADASKLKAHYGSCDRCVRSIHCCVCSNHSYISRWYRYSPGLLQPSVCTLAGCCMAACCALSHSSVNVLEEQPCDPFCCKLCRRTPVHAGPQHQQQQEDKYNGQLAEHSNSVWQLITFHPSIPTAPEAPIQSTVSVLQVAAGDLHCLLLDSHGGVWTLGSNNNGQLGTAGTQGLPAATPATAAVAESIEQPTQPAVASQQQQQQGLKVQPVMVMGPGSAATCQEPVAQVGSVRSHTTASAQEAKLAVLTDDYGHLPCCMVDSLSQYAQHGDHVHTILHFSDPW